MKIRILGIAVLLGLFVLSCKDDSADEPIWGKLDDHIFVVSIQIGRHHSIHDHAQ